MEDKIKIEQRIDDYILGRMSAEEHRRFEEDMESDEILRLEFESRLRISSRLEISSRPEFSSQTSMEISDAASRVHMKNLPSKAEEEYQAALSADIDRYIRNEMTSGERTEFERRMEENPEIKDNFEVQSQIAQSVYRNHLRELLTSAEAQYQKEKKAPFIKRLFRNITISIGGVEASGNGTVILRKTAYAFAVAASLTIVAIGGISIKGYGNAVKAGAEYMAYLPETMRAMGPEDDVAVLIDSAQTLMKDKEYKQAGTVLDEAETLAKDYICDILAEDGGADKYAQKIETLEIYAEDAQWCRAVCYMNDGKPGKAKKILKAIIAGDGSNDSKMRAEEALDKIKVFKKR